ncbi:MAG: hypothetical protein R6X02_14460 [Enhygromyxa sp.]
MPFQLLAEGSIAPGRKCLLLERTNQPSSGPWIGAFLYGPPGIKIRGQVSVKALLDMIQPGATVQNLGFLMLRQAPDTSQLAAFITAMLRAAERFPQRGKEHIGGFVLWLDALGDFVLDSTFALSMPREPINGPSREGPTSYRLETQTAHRVWDPGGAERLLSIHAPTTRAATLGPLGEDEGLEYVLQGTLPLSSEGGELVAELHALSVPFNGELAGCVVVRGEVQAGFRVLEPGFQHELVPAPRFGTPSQAPPGRLYHPILDPRETLAKAVVDLHLDPLAPAETLRNRLSLAPSGGSFASAYRTRLAEVLRLSPGQGAHFQAASARGGRIYFAPAGSFVASVADGDPAPLLGGLSGVEFFELRTGDQLVFSPGHNATVAYDDQDGLSFAAGPDAGLRVSWAAVVAASGSPEARAWISESERAPFFASASGAAEAGPLSFLPVPQRALPSAPEAAKPYPLLPYAALEPLAEGPGADPKLVRAFELGFVSPRRRDVLLELGPPPADQALALVHALTPQGYVATFEHGRLSALTLGQIDGHSGSQGLLRFASEGQELPARLREALFSNQQFIVMSAATEANADYQASATLSGWSFDLELPAPEAVVPGDYRTVLIIKSAAGSVEELARQPEAWTGYADFNNAALDPSGETLSAWLSTYISEAKAMYDDGNGVLGLQTFVEIVSNPAWNGFVFLRVPVDTGMLDPAIQFLLTGVDRDQFNAHHIGSAVNHAAVEAGAYAPNSAYFGLVHYLRPGTDPNRIVSNPFVPSTADFDFQLLLLDTSFESSIIASFRSVARLIVNRLFGDAIAPVSPDPRLVATNALLVYGSLQTESRVPRYAFATGEGQTSTFFPISAGFERIEIDRARISLEVGEGDATTDVARFNMAGWFGLGDRGEDFDLLSYAGIGFDNLVLTMTFPVGEDSSRATRYVLDSSRLGLSGLPERELSASERVRAATVAEAVVYRPGSLVSQLPLTATRLHTGAPGKRPGELGFGPLKTSASTGSASFEGAWYGLELGLPLGSAGALGSGPLLEAKLLLAWDAGGSGTSYASFFKLEGPGGANLSVDIQGVVKLGASAIFLSRTPLASDQEAGGQYVLQLGSIGLTVLTKTFPPAGTTNVFLAGFRDGDRRRLGWFGAYAAASQGGEG